MAGVKFTVQTSEISTGTSKKTVLQVLAPTNQRVVMKEWGIEFQGTSNTAAPILVEIARQTTAGLDGDVVTPRKVDSTDDETIQATALEDIDGSTQPTEGDVLFRQLIHPQGGRIWQAPFGEEIQIPGGTRLGIAVTAAAAVDMVAHMYCEE